MSFENPQPEVNTMTEETPEQVEAPKEEATEEATE